MNKIKQFFKEIFFCTNCKAKKPLTRWGIAILCPPCEAAKQKKLKAQCEVF